MGMARSSLWFFLFSFKNLLFSTCFSNCTREEITACGGAIPSRGDDDKAAGRGLHAGATMYDNKIFEIQGRAT